MTHIPQNSWPNTNLAKHYVLFTQVMGLLLSDNAFESFRAPVMNSLMRLHEFTNVSNQVLHRELPHKTLGPVRDELRHYIERDKIAASLIGGTFEPFISQLKQASLSDYGDVARLNHSVRLVASKINDLYGQRLERELLSVLSEPQEKSRMQELARDYVTYLHNFGYDRRYIRKSLAEVFLERDISRVGPHLLRSFFKRFSKKQLDYAVYVPIRSKDANALRGFKSFDENLTSFSELPQSMQKVVNEREWISNQDKFFGYTYRELDPFVASQQAQMLVKTYTALTVLEDKGLDISLRPYTLAARKNAKTAFAVRDDRSSIQSTVRNISYRKGESLRRNLNAILGNFDKTSRARILTAINGVSLARQSKNPENQITLIWSAIETLFGDPTKGSSRIDYYRSSLLKGILTNYAWRYSYAVFNQVQSNQRKSLQESLEESDIEKSISLHRQFQYFIFDPKFSPLHGKFMERIIENPALTQMVFRFYRRFSDPSSLRRSIKDHEDRVSWQIDRIYRARNDFVHAGQKPPFAQGLAINAFEYFRTCLQAMLYHAERTTESYSNLEDLTIEQISESLRLTQMARKLEVENASLDSEENIRRYLSIFIRR